MTELSEEQKQAIEQQKAQCPYCMIAAGKIPAKKVYEDDKILAAMEIYPASKGHIIVFPKEHYPIMPLIPQEEFIHLFSKIKDLITSMKGAIVTLGSTAFIANGGIAGQRMPHFKVDLIPRDKGDKLDNFIVPQSQISDEEISKVLPMFKNNMNIMMANHFKRMGKEIPELIAKNIQEAQSQNQGQGQSVQKEFTKEDVIKAIEGNPTFKNLLETKPEQLPELIKRDPSLAQFFKNVDVNEIIAHFNKNAAKIEKKTEAETNNAEKQPILQVDEKTENSPEKKPDLDAVSNLFLKK